MSASGAQKLVLVLLTIAYIFSACAEANRGWGWGWGSNQTGSSWGWGWGSNHSGGGADSGAGWGPGSNQTGSNWGWGWGWGSNHSSGSGSGWGRGWWGSQNRTSGAADKPRKIVVGGSAGWQYGFNYAEWASKNAPFYVDDILVFKYDPPAPFTHSVYLLPDLWSYMRCDVKRGKMIAKPSQGSGQGFEFVLEKWQPYYFACGEHDGAHCNNGTMKFTVVPMLRRW
ncbi:PREDICTED: putative glycine-rich cell wall structural protein 1 [Tarenaya hassleriana]|uniref:putative glycine-rich cell wall structural protein 1 n=1 Tax=Tarenaya hassleriana TaxID=28532 RepID=UPI00053CA634|nr:PREDICTED: putative glycine-rich cell wall structural protein 1 [Tarenaya hassleriana]